MINNLYEINNPTMFSNLPPRELQLVPVTCQIKSLTLKDRFNCANKD